MNPEILIHLWQCFPNHGSKFENLWQICYKIFNFQIYDVSHSALLEINMSWITDILSNILAKSTQIDFWPIPRMESEYISNGILPDFFANILV